MIAVVTILVIVHVASDVIVDISSVDTRVAVPR